MLRFMHKLTKMESPYVLAANLRRLMSESTELRTQEQVAKRAGIAQTSVSLMLRPDARSLTKSGKSPSPRMGEVERVAKAFRIELWQLLIDPESLSNTVARALATPPVADRRVAEAGFHKTKN